jgi:glycoside hydrolase-like protein
MNSPRCIGVSIVLLCAGSLPLFHAFSSGAEMKNSSQEATANRAYLGFDLNVFPGQAALPVLRKTFAFSGYWLSPPPGEKNNTWVGNGQREALRSQGFGFLLLYRGPVDRDLKNGTAATQKGTLDARNAAVAAKREGFPAHAIIFLDIEEGGRLSASYHAYLHTWASGVATAGYRAGAYCSGMPVKEGADVTITTADDIRAHAPSQDFVFFVYNDACPPSPGCTFPKIPPSPTDGGISYAAAWQYAQSPRRKEFTAHCAPGYHSDGNCYGPGDTTHSWFLDVDTATSPDPSNAAGANK